MGWQIDTVDPLPAAVEHRTIDRCDDFDWAWSRFRDDSLVARIAREPGRHPLPPEASELLRLYRIFYEATEGAMSPLVGRALEQWGYDASYRLRPEADIAPVPSWEDAIHWDGVALHTARPVVLDIGALGKGFLVDLLATELREADVTSFTIDASGDILHRGDTPLRVALEHPLDPSRAIGVATLADGALCASASNRRAWPGAHHVIDAVTGRPTSGIIATWAMSPTAAVADGLATALFFASPTVLARLSAEFDFEWVRMSRAGAVAVSPGFEGEVFS